MGILWPHSNSIVRNNSDARVPGAKAYFFEAGTTTPRTTYSDAALTTPRTHPVLADGNGRFPAIFLDFGSYRERVRTAGDTALWDTDNIPNPAPTDPGAGVDANSIFTTGDVFFSFRNGTRDGCVRCNGRTIGSATSGATERANSDCQNLFLYLWNNFANTICPVPGGRGASAGADWSANKTITLFDGRGTLFGGLADMGNSSAAHYSFAPVQFGGTTTGGSIIGSNTHQLQTADLPTFNPASTINGFTPTGTVSPSSYTPAGTITQSPITPTGSVTISDTRTWGYEYGAATNLALGGGAVAGNPAGIGFSDTVSVTGGAISGSFTGNPQTLTFAGSAQAFSFSGNAVTLTGSSIGSSAFHNNLPRVLLGTYYIKL